MTGNVLFYKAFLLAIFIEIIGLDESSPYYINKLKNEKIEKEELKKYNSNSSRVKFTPYCCC